jgi:hypothetical protein
MNAVKTADLFRVVREKPGKKSVRYETTRLPKQKLDIPKQSQSGEQLFQQLQEVGVKVLNIKKGGQILK